MIDNRIIDAAEDATEGLNVEITQADMDEARRATLEDGERPSERLFSIALSRQLNRAVKVHFNDDSTESYVEYLDGH